MNMKLEKNRVKRILLFALIAFLVSYFLVDISTKAANRLRLQGYEAAVIQLMDRASDDCLPFNIFAGDREISLINLECLQMDDPEEGLENL